MIMSEVLPIDTEQWVIVTSRHAETYSGRELESLRHKFTELHMKNIPTGYPNMPEDVRLAKKVKYEIGIKANLGGNEDIYDITTKTFGNESHDRDGDNNHPT